MYTFIVSEHLKEGVDIWGYKLLSSWKWEEKIDSNLNFYLSQLKRAKKLFVYLLGYLPSVLSHSFEPML